MVRPWISTTHVLVLATATFLVLVVAACASQLEAPRPTPEPSAVQGTGTAPVYSTVAPTATPSRESDASGREIRLTPAALPSLEPLPVWEPTLMTGEVPTDLLDAILEDAEARTGIEAGEMELLRAEAVTWGDGSLGCPQPDVMYTQTLVDGYWVVLQQGDQTLDYRATEGGYFVLCEGEQLSLPGLPGPDVSGTPQQ